MNWKFALVTCLLVAGLAFSMGAPPGPVIIGLILGAFLSQRRRGPSWRRTRP